MGIVKTEHHHIKNIVNRIGKLVGINPSTCGKKS